MGKRDRSFSTLSLTIEATSIMPKATVQSFKSLGFRPECNDSKLIIYLGCTSLALCNSSNGDCGLAYRTERRGVEGLPSIVFLGVFVHDWDEPAVDLRTQNRREVDSSLLSTRRRHDGVARGSLVAVGEIGERFELLGFVRIAG